VLCEDVIRAHLYEPENMSIDELHSLIQRLVQQGHLSRADAPQPFNTYQTLTPTPTEVSHTSFPPNPPFLTGTGQPYNIIHSNTGFQLGYTIPHTNNSPHTPNSYFNATPSRGDLTATENHPRALAAPSANPYTHPGAPASFANSPTRHESYVAHPGQGSFQFVNQDQTGQLEANHLPPGYGFDAQPMPRGYP